MTQQNKTILTELQQGIPLQKITQEINLSQDSSVPHAPNRPIHFDDVKKKLAVKNALRYFPEECHADLASEFLQELNDYGHIYMYRFRPTEYEMKAYPIGDYPAKCQQAAAIMLMIMNNLNPAVAQFPHELITYGGNGSVLSNWGQYHLVMKYLSEMEEDQTLVMYSGHPLGLFPSNKVNPRVVITNGMVIPNYSSPEDYQEMYGLGVSQFGQMTAGSYCYIGPQGIVHGTTLTIMNAGRKYLGLDDLTGKILITSGLGGMSGAQPKAGVIAGITTIVAEVNRDAVQKRFDQGWILEIVDDIEVLIQRIKETREQKIITSIGFHGNIVEVWERLTEEEDLLVELGSDQTSLHNPYNGGYYPAGLSVEESNEMMVSDPVEFKKLVKESLVRQISAINKLTARGMKFWDYGNSFLLEASRANADVQNEDGSFIYPSYVEDIMGDIFSLGFGPFRWVCTSGNPEDLSLTDKTAADVCRELSEVAPVNNKMQYEDNLTWITQAEENQMVVGSQARILYSDAVGRAEIALRFNALVREGKLDAPVVLSRDHHDVSGTDSPWRETSNVYDGSRFTADMAVQNFCGLAMRGATWVALHNGGGTGWGEAINGGFGLFLDGSESTDEIIKSLLEWDVLHGVTRRAWSGNENAKWTISRAMEINPRIQITYPNTVDDNLLDDLIQ